MKTQSKWLGIIVMVAVIGFSFATCKNGGGGGSTSGSNNGDTNYLDTVNLNNGSPTNAALAAGGLTQSQFNQIRDASGGFQGWAIEDDDLVMVWTGRSLSNFNSVADVLKTLFGEKGRDNELGFYTAFLDNYVLYFFPTEYSEGGIFTPAGFMMLLIFV